MDGHANLLRRTLQANSVFSAASGVAAITGAGILTDELGTGHPAVLVTLGLGLVVYAIGLWWTASKDQIDRRIASAAVVMDVAWVAGSVVLVAAGPLTATGNWTAVLVADMVLLFAVLQFLGLRRSATATQPIAA
jgi:hypothetical protein